MKLSKIIINLILSFLIGLLAFYVVTRTVTITSVFVCLTATGIVGLWYLLVYLINKKNVQKNNTIN